MRNIRNILLSLIVAIAGVIPATTVQASDTDLGGVSAQSAEPRSTTLPTVPTKWKTVTFKMGPSIKYWTKVAQCETRQDWQDGGNWGGGLGIARSTWKAYGGQEFASHPSKATVLEQSLFAALCPILGKNTVEEVARHFEHTADQELKHAWGHLELLVGKPSTKECLQMAIDGETYEFTEMYPQFQAIAETEGLMHAAQIAKEQIQESQEHALQFTDVLNKAEKRFAALKRVEEKHADAYKQVLGGL
jgi:rubrerythrin